MPMADAPIIATWENAAATMASKSMTESCASDQRVSCVSDQRVSCVSDQRVSCASDQRVRNVNFCDYMSIFVKLNDSELPVERSFGEGCDLCGKSRFWTNV